MEHLNAHQLFESLWKGDEDGRVLLMVGSVADELVEEYDKDMFEITQEIFKCGLEKYEERKLEIEEFLENLEEGQKEIQLMGQKIVEDFLRFKTKLFDEATDVLRRLEIRTINGEDEVSTQIFFKKIYN